MHIHGAWQNIALLRKAHYRLVTSLWLARQQMCIVSKPCFVDVQRTTSGADDYIRFRLPLLCSPPLFALCGYYDKYLLNAYMTHEECSMTRQ